MILASLITNNGFGVSKQPHYCKDGSSSGQEAASGSARAPMGRGRNDSTI